jgi:predicted lactoylglutathione lyase
MDAIVISLPIEDRRTSHDFYRALGYEAVGGLATDGLPEPLQFALNDGVRLMLVPRGGFGWVIGDNEVAGAGVSECVLSLEADVDPLIERARAAGATIVSAPAQQPWGYTGTFADPDGHLWMVTSGA